MRHTWHWAILLFLANVTFAQQDQSGILKTILSHYFKNEKPVVKGRSQFLFVFCDKANNNEELFETINGLNLPKAEASHLKNQVNNEKAVANWASEFNSIFTPEATMLASKVNSCLSLEDFLERQNKSNFKNQRLMIISKPVFFADGKTALVKIVFYRSIEHNSGSVLLMKKNGEFWEISSFLNPWET